MAQRRRLGLLEPDEWPAGSQAETELRRLEQQGWALRSGKLWFAAKCNKVAHVATTRKLFD